MPPGYNEQSVLRVVHLIAKMEENIQKKEEIPMAQRGIREYVAKKMLAKYLPNFTEQKFVYPGKVVLVSPETDLAKLPEQDPWLKTEKLTVKPDQLFGKRGKHGLLLLDADFEQARKWIDERMNKETTVGKNTDKLTHFLIEPFTPHKEEYYAAITSTRDKDIIYFSLEGGIEIEENWDKVTAFEVPIFETVNKKSLEEKLSVVKDASQRKMLAEFLAAFHAFYAEMDFSYLEINPFTIVGNDIIPLDTVAKLDDTAAFKHSKEWEGVEFPPPFGRKLNKEESYISQLDEKTGASLKLTVLNPEARIWTMVAGGGASVIYADTIVDLGFSEELANYGEYSGNPNTEMTYLYAKTILDLMTRKKDPKGREKYLLIGGGIANFTDVAKTFTGIIQALTEYKDKLKENNVKIYIRRGGPNYEEGLRKMRELGKTLGMTIEVYGPETHMTKIVSLALQQN